MSNKKELRKIIKYIDNYEDPEIEELGMSLIADNELYLENKHKLLFSFPTTLETMYNLYYDDNFLDTFIGYKDSLKGFIKSYIRSTLVLLAYPSYYNKAYGNIIRDKLIVKSILHKLKFDFSCMTTKGEISWTHYTAYTPLSCCLKPRSQSIIDCILLLYIFKQSKFYRKHFRQKIDVKKLLSISGNNGVFQISNNTYYNAIKTTYYNSIQNIKCSIITLEELVNRIIYPYSGSNVYNIYKLESIVRGMDDRVFLGLYAKNIINKNHSTKNNDKNRI